MFRRALALAGLFSCLCSAALAIDEPVTSLPSETPEKFTPNLSTFDFEKREV